MDGKAKGDTKGCSPGFIDIKAMLRLRSIYNELIQGDQSGSSQPPVDIKTKVAFECMPPTLKQLLF